jgi:hypothetical protein
MTYHSYKNGCSPEISTVFKDGLTVIEDSYCYNVLDYNQNSLLEKAAIRCYLCDSRVDGLTGCSTLDISSKYVYDSGSSSSSEACAVSNLRQ